MTDLADDILAPFDELQASIDVNNSDAEQALSQCRERRFEPLGLGAGRIAIAFGPQAVVKIAWRERGQLDNQIEARLWDTASDQLRDLLCPVISLRQSGALVQARCLPIVSSALDPDIHIMISNLAQHGITDGAVNLGVWGEAVVCYDYATVRPEIFTRLFPDITKNFGNQRF